MISSKKVKTVLLCILMAICLTLFPVSLSMLASNNTGTATAASYSFIDVTVDKGYKATSGITTVEGLKKNLTVTGVDDSGSYALFDDEYDITIGDGATTNDDGVITSDKGATVFNAIAKYGSLARDFQVTFAESAPVIGALTVEVNGSSITDDYTADTVYKVLTVKSGETVLTPDLYTVTMDDIYNSSTATIVVKAGSSQPVSKTVTVTVNHARLKGVELNVKDGLTLVDGRYKRDGRDVFIRGANHQAVFANLNIFAVFENGKKLLTPNFNTQGELSGVQTGESIRANNLPVSATENENFTVTVTRGSSAATSNNLNINFAVTEIIAIEVNTKALEEWNNHNKLATESLGEGDRVLYPYTQLNLSNMMGDDGTPVFRLLRNDGTYDTSLSNLAVDGSLAPAAGVSGTYNKPIKVVYNVNNSNVSTDITVKNINFVKPASMSIEGQYATQIKHGAPILNGLQLRLNYMVDGQFLGIARIPLTESNATISTNPEKILNNTGMLTINVDYNGLTNSYFDTITVVNDRIPLPMTDMSTVTFTNGCKKSFTNYDPGIMQLEVLDKDLNPVEEALYVINGSDVEFKSGGIYNIKISLKPDENGKIIAKDGVAYPVNEFVLYNEGTTSGVSISGDGHSAVYTIQINKGTLAVNIEEPAVENIYYGDKLGDLLQVTGTSNGRSTNLNTLGVSYKLVFIREGSANPVNSELPYDKLTFENYTVPEKLNAGKYTVYAVTQANEAYLAGKVRENRGLELEIFPVEISSSSLSAEVEYARKEFKLSELITYNGFVSGENAETVLTVKSIKKDNKDATLRFVGTYTVTVALKDNGEEKDKYNYAWSDGVGDKAITVKIKEKEFPNFKVSLAKDTFYYGDVTLTPSKTGEDSNYFTVDLSSYTYSATVTSLNTLAVGTYTVNYTVTPKYDTAAGEVEGNCFKVPQAKATFTINEAEINPVSVDDLTVNVEKPLGDYKKNGYQITVKGWTSPLVNGSSSQKAYDGLNFKVEYTPLSTGHTITDPAVSNANGQVTFKDAGAYVVTISLKANYKWAGDTTGDIVYKVSISRAALDEPALSDSVAYNGTEQTVNVTDWEEKFNGLVTYTVKGATLAAIDAGEVEHDNDGTFKVIYAGNYTLTFSLGDNVNNYGWGSNKSTDDCVKTYTVLQANLKVNWTPTEQDFKDELTEQTIEAEATPFGNFGEDNEKLVITEYKIYSDKECTEEVTEVTKAGTYYLLVTEFGLKDGVTGFNPANYKLAEDGTGIKCTYEIRTQSLATPVLLDGYTNNKITKTYKGAAYDITEFFVDGGKYYDNSGKSRLEVTVTGGPELKDVIISGENIGSYTVTVKPAGNYKWSGDNKQTVYTYTVTIEKAELEFDWVQTEFDYDGEIKTPKANVKGLLGTDKDVIVNVNVEKQDAGSYTIAFSDLSLSGTRAHNYTLKNVAIDKNLVINRKVITTPSANRDSATFNEAKQTVTYTLPEDPELTVVPDGACTDSSYKYENGIFTFYHAGTYTVTFTLPNFNYCWDADKKQDFSSDSATLNYKHTVTVDKMQVEAPALGSKRAIERDSFNTAMLELANSKGVNTTYAFGEYANGTYVEKAISIPPELKVYFVKLTFSPDAEKDGFTPLAGDYVWIDNDTDKKNTDSDAWGYLISKGGVYGYADGTDMYLCFVITQSQVIVTFAFAGYTFGDNGWINTETTGGKSLIGDKHTLNDIQSSSSGLITFINDSESGIPDSAVYTITVSFFTDSECKNAVTEALSNGLPWSVGTYYAKIDVQFEYGSYYQNFARVCQFAVAQRPLEIEWENKPTAEYNGAPQTRTPTISNMRYSSSDCWESEIPDLTFTNSDAVNVKYVGGAVADYDLEVTFVAGGNYTLTNGVNLTSTFKITPMALTVEAKAITYTYGDALDFLENITYQNYSNYYEITSGTVFNNEYNCIKLVLGGTLDSYGLPTAGGDYTVTPALKVTEGNYTLTPVSGDFEVSKRTVTLTYSGDVKHVYGEAFNLGSNVTCNNLGVRTQNVYKLYLVDSENVRTEDKDSDIKAGTYTVKIQTLDTVNYNEIVFTADVTYTVELAQITNATAEGYTGTYDGEAHEAIKNYSANAVNNQTLIWWVAEAGADGTYDENGFKQVKTAEGKVTNVLQRGTYKVKVTAPNHEDKILDGTVTVEIKQVEVTISVNINIFYGETGPEAHGTEEGKWFKQSFVSLTEEGGIYTVAGFVNDTDRAAFANGTLSELGGQETFSYGYADNVTYAQGSNIGDYKLIFNCGTLKSENYSFVGGESRLRVLALPVKVTLKNLTAKYNQANPPEVYTAVVSITTAQTSNYDGKPITVYGTQADILTVATDALTSSTGKTTNVVADYTITAGLKLTDGKSNYILTDDSIVLATYSITKTENGLTDNYGLFTFAKSYKELAANSENAWIYGVYTDVQTDGYNASGDQEAVEATFVYDEEEANAEYTLYNADSQSPIMTKTVLAELFGGGLDAGDYRVQITFPAGDNYEAVDESLYFRIGKRGLTVTADAQEIQYGYDAPNYSYKVSGYANGEDEKVFGESKPVFESDYVIGNNADAYDIVYGGGAESLDNYTVAYTGNTLTVSQREVTIVIEHKESTYTYYNDTPKEQKELTYSIPDNTSIYNNENVFTLKTTQTETSTVGDYPIYAVFNNETFANNYKITVANSGDNLYSGGAFTPEGTLVHANAGIYTIVPARLVVMFDATPKSSTSPQGTEPGDLTTNTTLTYDGLYKGYVLTQVPEEAAFRATYWKYGQDESNASYDMPKEVGKYVCRFVSDNENYTWSSNDIVFEITGQNLRIKPLLFDEKTGNYVDMFTPNVEYKNGNYELKFTFEGIVEGEEVAISSSVSAVKTGDSYFVNNNSFNPFGTLALTSEGNNVYTISFINVGDYTVEIQLGSSVYNYTLSPYKFNFTVNRKSLDLKADNTFVQYGTQLIKANGGYEAQPGVTVNKNGKDMLADGYTLEDLYDMYRFAGFTLTDGTMDIIKDQPTGFFDISKLTFTANGYNAAYSGQGSFDITPDVNSVHAYNYDLTAYISGAKLNVIQRRITVTVNGYTNNESWASATYTGENIEPAYEANRGYYFTPAEEAWYGAATTDSGNIVSAAKIRLRIDGGAVNVRKDGYPITAEQHSENGTSNYKVTFVNKDGKAPAFMIKQKSLTISVVSSVDGKNVFDVVYGNSTNGLYKVVYTGLVEKDGGDGDSAVDSYNIASNLVEGAITYPDSFTERELSGTAVTSKKYEAWLSHAGSKYQISAESSGIKFTNYAISYRTATMTVVSRKITAQTQNRTYTEIEENGVKIYNGGASGIYHIAPVTFKDIVSGITYTVAYKDNGGIVTGGTITVNYGDGKTALSNTTFALKYQNNVTVAPVKAGENQVTITLTGKDFVFDTVNTTGTANNSVIGTVSETSATFEYDVEKQALDFARDPVTDETTFFKWEIEDAGVKHVDISDYVGDIMDIVTVQRIFGKTTETFGTTVSSKGGYYAVGDNKLNLSVYPNGVGIYVVTVRLNGTADENYVWKNGNQEATVQFTFASEKLTITSLSIKEKGWTYLGYDSTKNAITITNDVNVDESAFAFTYAEYTGSIPEGQELGVLVTTLDSKLPDNSTFGQVLGGLSYRALLPTDAGTYVLKAEYRGETYGTAVGYCLFTITPKAVKAPVLDGENVSYDMNEHTAAVTYDSNALGYTYATLNGNGNGIVSPSSNKVTVTATNADTYILTFTITDTKNYVWAENAGAENGAVRREWTIAKATDNEVTVKAISIGYGEQFEVTATSKYGGEFTYSYAVRGNEASPLANAQWHDGKPVNAGKYWIKAVCGETANFTQSTGSGELTINKATLTATPEGHMTYGDSFSSAVKEIKYTGWKNGELEVTGNVSYEIIGYNKESLLNVLEGGYQMTVNGVLTVTEGHDDVFGFDIDNYDIQTRTGVFTVNKLAVEVTIDNLTITYGEAFNPSDVKLTDASVAKLVGADREAPFAALNITPTVLGSMTNGYYIASAYVLSSTGHENSVNYEVSVRTGIFTVKALDVYITVDAGGGEYGDVTPAAVTHVYTGDGIDVEEKFGNLAPSFGFLYSGTANDGTVITNSSTAPALAGNYTAVARVTQFIGNYNLVTDRGTPSVTFIVSRKTITESDISVEEIKFNNEDQSPVIIDEKYSDLYTAEEVAFREVGGYTVTLTLKDADNYKWSSVEGGEYSLPFSIERGDNEFTSDIIIRDWNFGDSANTPETETVYGDSADYIFTYSTSEDGEYTRTVPTAAGTYWVKVTVPQSENYNEKTSDPVKFTIGKRAVKAPALETVAEGDNANTTYTGGRLQSAVKDYDPVIMRIIYEGDLSSAGSLAVYAVNAGEYKVYFALNDEANYTWAEGTALSENNAVLVWNVARKKIAKPEMDTSLYMVNGGTLTFMPEGFDESTMAIAGNTTSYGGVFKVTVSIKDTVNFEWADGSVEDITFDWIVVGWDTVFIIVVSVLGVVAGIAAIAIGIQYLVHRRKKSAAAASEAAAEAAFHESVAAMAEGGDVPPDDGGTPEQPAEEEEPSFNEPAEEKPEQGEENTQTEEVKEEATENTEAPDAENNQTEEGGNEDE